MAISWLVEIKFIVSLESMEGKMKQSFLAGYSNINLIGVAMSQKSS